MSALDHNPSNKNYLSSLTFQFNIKRAPNVNFFVQSVVLPGLTLESVEQTTPFISIPQVGDHIDYDELSLHFKVNEDLSNWLEIYNWIKNTGFPDNYDQYASLSNQSKTSGLGLKSDISLLISNNNKILNIDATFKDAFPTSLSSLQFDSTPQDVRYFDAVVTFKYRTYDISII